MKSIISNLKTNKVSLFLLITIVAIGAFFRFYGINWDQNSHLHPDERFLTMVGNAMKLPQSFPDYFNPQTSTFNPANVGFNFFVYGIFPVSLNKLTAIILGNDNYNDFTLQGRFISGLLDLFIIILIYKTVLVLEKKYNLDSKIKYFASFFYSIFVLPIQLSHFFAVDTFLNFFGFLSFFFALNYWVKKKKIYIILSAVSFGLAAASKITAVFLLPLIISLLIDFHRNHIAKSFKQSFLNLAIFASISYVSLKVSNPYIFASTNVFNPNPMFLESLKSLKILSSKSSTFPPNIQWINKIPILFPLKNLIFFGVGIPSFILFTLGIFNSLKTRAKFIFGGILIWMIVFFIYQGTQTAMTMRYFLILYPFVAIFSSLGIYAILKNSSKYYLFVFLLIAFLWTLLFVSIYTKPHSRVEATEWINKNIQEQKVILSEHWDDALPLQNSNKYHILELPVFDPDTSQKWEKMNELLQKGDYLILSSNRGWGSIPTAPERYPKMTKFYKDLFEGKLVYKKIKEFTSYPSLSYLGIPLTIPDDSAEEAFTVYDHPKIMVFKKQE